MSAPNFVLITELQATIRRDFPLASSSILSPYDARPLVEGEWLELNSDYQLARAGDNNGSTADEGLNPAFPVHTEKGRYDVQAIQKANVIFFGMFEADTLLHAADLSSGYTVGTPLTVQDVSVSGIVRRTVAAQAGTDERMIVGFVSKVTGTGTTALLRFVHFGCQKATAI